MNVVLFLGTIFDPRYKLDYVKLCFSYIYEDDVAAKLLKKIEDTLQRLFNEYDEIPVPNTSIGSQGSQTQPPPSTQNSSTSLPLGAGKKIFTTFIRQRLVNRGGSENELDHYLNEITEDHELMGDNFDILAWWKANSCRYQVLS